MVVMYLFLIFFKKINDLILFEEWDEEYLNDMIYIL